MPVRLQMLLAGEQAGGGRLLPCRVKMRSNGRAALMIPECCAATATVVLQNHSR